MTWPEGSEDPEGKASEKNPDVVRSAHNTIELIYPKHRSQKKQVSL